MVKVNSIKGKIILDSRGKETIEVFIEASGIKSKASVPSGTSRGEYEAIEVLAKKAVFNIKKIVEPFFKNKTFNNALEIDNALLGLDGTKNKSYLGVNTVLSVSIAFFRLFSKIEKIPLWLYIRRLFSDNFDVYFNKKIKIPDPCILMIEGGLHAKTGLDIQEFMIIPKGKSFKEKFLIGKKIYNNLKNIFKKRLGVKEIDTGMEGALTPPVQDIFQVLDSICLASDGYKVKVGLDCAGSHLIKNKYNTEFYKKLINNYPIIFLEDPFGENDWNSWRNLKKSIKNKYKVLLVGDDLTVTNPTRIKLAQTKKVCDAVIIKPNQVGSVSEAMESVALAKSYNWKTIVSHRSGETMDDFISDFAVGVQSDYIKIGAPFAKERFVKYKRLIKIEESLN